MGKFYDEIPPELIPWLLKQELFWVATAPLSPEQHINVSPKGVRDSFHVLSPTRVWYQDLTGSGVETISHLRENGRITLMFAAFEGPPRIVRLFGTGTVHEFGTRAYEELIPPEKRRPGSRAAIVVDVHKVGSSCGYAVPYYEFRGHRQVLLDYWDKRELAEQKGGKGLKAYWEEKNLHSIDGLPGLATAPGVEKTPECTDVMKKADNAEDGTVVVNSTANVAGKGGHATGVRRVQELVVAFALGVAVAAVYVQLAGAA
ncbi:hypothetical protein BD309DRAFT_929263 [Dichomitus squalens]|uniref:Pyridoxamine 5'-phosphate oxidase N-terminal domain-containing protein n=2 Tax=Dichomitus squalens TaxID=114155 RepID=A0A4Q9M4W1_9APHY|nr:uncharacterized protein DICSQDRAFT_162874 [Dichomitus squalens LYAD-421 SS1]EJF58546.1 hypothetical protein DICSQDRAFT_162874 [Dichomitus squalens LYAD-421 SS1]TBU21889.1 hypothetical protein BD311DRAFT_178875 [Dichomitus squalens]TBU39279.1 hypothetical protein BD309DRAFT_929263 [Dichomitus squalens]TBU51641.1 hypothetical protein BD310DRAFT_863045 [Dichomitus squalens]